MVAQEPEVGVPLDDGVVGGEVGYPQEALAAQLNGVGHEVEHGYPNGHLNKHGQAAGERTDAVFGVLAHHGLLLFHLIFRLVELSSGGIQLRLEHAHLGRTHVAFLHQRIGDELEQKGDENEDDAHVDIQPREPVENIEGEPSVDDTEERPSQVDEALEFEVFAEVTLAFYLLEKTEVVGTVVEVELGGLTTGGIEEGFELGLIVFQIA